MTTPALPSALSATRLLAALSLRRARRGRLVRVVMAILLLPILSALVALISGRGGTAYFDMVLTIFLRYLVPLVMALQATSAVAEEVQGKTITYLFARPIPRWTVPLGKYLGSVALSTVLLCASIVATYLLSTGSEIGEGLPDLALALGTVTLAAVHFGAMATAFGSMVTGYPFAAMMVYLLLVDIGLGFIPGVFKAASMGVHLTVLAGLYQPHTDTFFMPDPALTPAIALPVVLATTAIWLLIALSWVGSHEYRE